MTKELAARDRATRADQKMLLDQREANEQLVLAGIRAQELTDLAEAAQARAELVTEKLRESERELLATAEFREQLLGIVGHDLRNPLGAISMCAQFLSMEGKYDRESVATLVEYLLKSVHRMDQMIKQLFEFTRARLGGGVPLELAAADLQPLCNHAIEELKHTAPLPIQAEYIGDTTGIWDGERLIEALSNLLGNALEHATAGTAVRLKVTGLADEVVTEISNQGDPIPTDLLPLLFVAFHRGRTGIRSRPGHLGLGLYIAHEIARSHQGTLTTHAAAGWTTFELRLPRQLTPPSAALGQTV